MTKILYIPEGRYLIYTDGSVYFDKAIQMFETPEHLLQYIIAGHCGFCRRNKLPRELVRSEFEIIYD